MISFCVLAAPIPALVPLVVCVAGLLILARATLGEIGKVIRGFSGFLFFFGGLGVVFEPTWAQAAFLAIQALRLTLLLLLGHLLFLAATPSDVTEGIQWSLGWLGRRKAWAAANMAGWALASVPLVLDQAATLNEASALRGHSARRHPLGALKLITLALLVRTVERSTDLAEALEARGFGVSVPGSKLASRLRDALAFGGVAAWCAASWAFGVIVGS
jgi:energy-coupling factor transporter transmembrane protein EcfT